MSVDDAVSEMTREQLENRVRELESEVQNLEGRLDAYGKQLSHIKKALFGPDEFFPDDVGSQGGHHLRIADIEDEIEQVRKNNEMLVTDIGNGRDDPDGRARLIRQTLLNKANSDGKASLTRDEASARLGGDLHRDSVLGAMKRAADGKMAEKADRSYTPINGSSDLQPVESVTFRVSKGKDKQSRVLLDLDDATQKEVRHNLTTEEAGRGDAE